MNNRNANATPICNKHRREFEALCVDCKTLICATCTLNNEHTSHKFMSIIETCKHVRNTIDQNIKFNVLRPQHTEEKLIRLKQARLQIEVSSQELMSNIDEVVQTIIDNLKTRRNCLFESIQEISAKEISVIMNHEALWKEKENIRRSIIQMGHNPNDNLLLTNVNFILNGIENLKEKISDHRANVINDFDLNFKVFLTKVDLNYESNSGNLKMSRNNISKSQLQNSHFLQKIYTKDKDNSNKNENSEIIIQNNKEFFISLDQLLDSINNMFTFKEPNIIEYKS